MRRIVFQSTNFTFAVPLLIFINFCVFILWQILGEADNSFMTNNFLVSWTLLSEGRAWTALTSAFSHNMFFHFFINMYVLLNFGRVVERILGFKEFFKFYVVAGIISSLSHSLVSAYFMHDPFVPALGASGAIAGIILLFAMLFPKEKILILGIIPMPAIFGALAFIGLDIWGLTAQMGGHGLPIGHGAHLGGAFTGILYYFIFLRSGRLERKRQARTQKFNPFDNFNQQTRRHDTHSPRPNDANVIDVEVFKREE